MLLEVSMSLQAASRQVERSSGLREVGVRPQGGGEHRRAKRGQSNTNVAIGASDEPLFSPEGAPWRMAPMQHGRAGLSPLHRPSSHASWMSKSPFMCSHPPPGGSRSGLTRHTPGCGGLERA